MENTNKTMDMLGKEKNLHKKENEKIDFVKFYAKEFNENKRDIEKEILAIAQNNLNMSEEDAKKYVISKWAEDDALQKGEENNKNYEDAASEKLNAKLRERRSITKEDAIRLCFYLKVPFVNTSDEYSQRFNSVDKFMKTLLHQNGLCYRVYDDIFWYIELKREPEKRMGFIEVKKVIDSQKREFMNVIDNIRTLQEYVEFVLQPKNAIKIYACLNGTEYYNNGDIKKYVKRKYNNDLIAISEEPNDKGKSLMTMLSDNFKFSEKDISEEKLLDIINKSLTHIIVKTLEEQSKDCNTYMIKKEIDKSEWTSVEDAKESLTLVDDKCSEVIKNLAAASLTLKKTIDSRLRQLTKYSIDDVKWFISNIDVRNLDREDLSKAQEASLYNVKGVMLSDKVGIDKKYEDKKDKKYKNAVDVIESLTKKIDFESMRYVSRLKTKAGREAFILVTLALEMERVRKEEEPEYTILKTTSREDFFIEYLNKELERMGLGRLDARYYFDALIIIISSSDYDYIENIF